MDHENGHVEVGYQLLASRAEPPVGLVSARRGSAQLGPEIADIVGNRRLAPCSMRHSSSWTTSGKLVVAVMGMDFAQPCS